MPEDNNINVIIHAKTKRGKINMVTEGELAIMNLEDFFTLLKAFYELKQSSDRNLQTK